MLQGRGTRARRATAQAASSALLLPLGLFPRAGRRAVEIATDAPSFTVDEPKETPGNAIKLPPWYESRRAEIVTALPPLR